MARSTETKTKGGHFLPSLKEGVSTTDYWMKYLVLADLHDDFWAADGRDPFADISDEIAELDLLVLAGDISNKPKTRWKAAFARLSDKIDLDKVHVFPGNHDFYDFRLDDEHRLADFARASGVHYTNCNTIVRPGLRLICTTLWTDFTLPPGRIQNENYIPTRMNDFRYIRLARGGYRRIKPGDLVSLHLSQKAWLLAQLSTPFDGQTIVVTHHAPTPEVLPTGPGFEPDLAAAYASDLTQDIAHYQPDAWLFGHCHAARPARIGRTDISCVSLGYPFEVDNPTARLRSLIRTV